MRCSGQGKGQGPHGVPPTQECLRMAASAHKAGPGCSQLGSRFLWETCEFGSVRIRPLHAYARLGSGSRRRTTLQQPGGTEKTDAPVQLRNRRDCAMRGLGYDARIERSVTSSQLTGPPPCFLTFVRRVHSETFEEGLDTPRFFASEWIICGQIDCVLLALSAGLGA